MAVHYLTTHDETRRFPAFWGPNFDGTPDQCLGGNCMLVLQRMLLQADGNKILLFPAWPKDWDVDFKLHLSGGAVLTGTVKDGKLVTWDITPAERKVDVVVCGSTSVTTAGNQQEEKR